MSTEPATVSLETLRRSARAEALLTDVDVLLADVATELNGILADLGDAGPGNGGPLAVDLVGELTARVLHHGKRLRPLLAGLGWDLAGGTTATREALTQVAAALELLQLFALVQDDVMDRSDERRGRATLHVVCTQRHRDVAGLGDAQLFGDSVAVLVADLALSEATLLAARAGPETARDWRIMATELVHGQLLDLTHTAGRHHDLPAARRIARLKSGRYTITRPLELGAGVAGAAPDLLAGLRTWGDLVGDAFALRDDVLGVWGDPAVTGKPAGDDLRSGKPTVLRVWAEELLPVRERELLAVCDRGELGEDGVRALQEAMRAAGVLDRAEETVADLVARSHAALDALPADPETAEAMRGVAHAVAWRSR